MLSATMTSPRQTSLFTKEKLTSLQEDSHANPTHKQESDWGKKMSDISGRRCLEQYERFNHDSLWAKMFPGLLIGMEGWSSTRCKLTWKLKATRSHRLYFQLAPSTLPTEGIGFGLLPTVQTQGLKVCSTEGKTEFMDLNLLPTPIASTGGGVDNYSNKNGGNRLVSAMKAGLLPTPKVEGKEGYETRAKRQGHEKAISHLEAFVEYAMLPTPAASNYKGASSIEALEARGRLKQKADNLADQFAVSGKTSQLNPRFVMEMMGFPPDWTELPFLNGETNPSKQEETQ